MDPYIVLNNGARMPRVGLGTWKAPAEKTKEAVLTAVRAGYRLIDCANDYDNEHAVGEALQELLEAGEVKREELFIQAKLWNSNHRPEHVKPDLEATLKDLQLDYIDSFVIHWPQAVPSTGKIFFLHVQDPNFSLCPGSYLYSMPMIWILFLSLLHVFIIYNSIIYYSKNIAENY